MCTSLLVCVCVIAFTGQTLLLCSSTTWFTIFSCSSFYRTSVIHHKDHPPDKKAKSEKPLLPSNEFDPTGNFTLWLLCPNSYFSHSFCFSLVTLYLSIFSVGVWMPPRLPHMFLSDHLSFSLTLTLTNCFIEQICSWWFVWHVYISLYALCLINVRV